jgi:type II secretory pathway pseudopilin PulG
MNRKVAFSLVEMAVVLMVIGIIVGISIKTLAIIDTAKNKKDLTTVTRLEAGLKSYLSTTGAIPPDNITVPAILETAPLISMHYISADDLLSATHKNHKWVYRHCGFANNSGEFTPDNTTQTPYEKSGDMICLALRDSADSDVNNVDMYTSFACAIETQFDDRNILRGKGRSAVASDSTALVEEDYIDCPAVLGSVQYMYRVF